MTTIREIAKATNKSAATVSRVLNKDESFSVSRKTKDLIIQTADQLGYEKPKRFRKTIQVISSFSRADEAVDPFLLAVQHRIIEEAQKRHIQLLPTKNIVNPYTEIDIKALSDPDALLVLGNFTQKAMHKLYSLNNHVIVINDRTVSPTIDGVYFDTEPVIKSIFNQDFVRNTESLTYISNSRKLRELDGTESVNTSHEKFLLDLKIYADSLKMPLRIRARNISSKSGTTDADWFLASSKPTDLVMLDGVLLANSFIRDLLKSNSLEKSLPKLIILGDTNTSSSIVDPLASVLFPVDMLIENAFCLLSSRLSNKRHTSMHIVLEPILTLAKAVQ